MDFYKEYIILLSIKPKFVKNILNGTKKFEYRKRIPTKNVKTMAIYSSYPECKVVALVDIDAIIKLPVEELWETTKYHSGITKEFFDKYFKNKKYGYAYCLGYVYKFPESYNIEEFNCKKPPQDFQYIGAITKFV